MLIPVQAGQNRVHMSFTPIGLRVGLVTNAIALGLLIGLVVFERRTRQRQLYRKRTHEASSGDVARVETDEKREEE